MRALELLNGLVTETGQPWGAIATDWQVADAQAVLEPGDGPRRHWIGRPRGASKTGDVAGFLLAELLSGNIPPSNPCYIAASDKAQAGFALDSLAGFVRRSGLSNIIELQTYRALHRPTGASIEVIASDSSGAYGHRPSRLVLDELAQWQDSRASRKVFEGLWSSLPKTASSIGVIITTAGVPGHFSHEVFERAMAEPQQWRVSMLHEVAPWIDPELVQAERRRLSDSAFLRLWCNQWASPEDALVSGDDLSAAVLLDGPVAPIPGQRYCLTLDVGLVDDACVLVAAHKEGAGADERVIIDRLWRWQGSRKRPVNLTEVELTIAEAHERYNGAELLADPFQAVQLIQSLTKRGIRASKFDFTSQSVGRIASSLVRLLRAHRLSLPADDALLAELASVRVVENSLGTPRLDHDRNKHDDQAVAIALACHRLTDGAPVVRRPPRLHVYPRSDGWPESGTIVGQASW